ncbi:CaiB/BaiF CoA transferase family protein [Aurantiacibacter marinus]|uniref:Acetyl-CoA acetyltransferase n=1 Tax=Aurantiacibacter marinus TaxID=874156 RepID=A0A0H0XK97_9SPHN|nr:CoA transferase [Aurantiacibacter marinus]KLI63028.1 acetyl-CoA acetyltransferase [Aurantiacibacter marinus]
MTAAGAGKGPLKGVRVLDLTSVLMGPYTTQIFADLGADVIKVEAPSGDTTRSLPPGPADDCGAMFMNVNRGKRSLVLDLKQANAREALLRMAEDADVFIHSMRAKAMGRLGLSYAELKARNPKIIYANLYGYGREGPYADFPAYDDIVQAASGIVDLQASLSGGEPTYLATVVADKVAGLTAAYAVMAALFERERSGRGQEIEVPMFETLASFSMVEHLCGALFDPPIGPTGYARALSPERKPYRTKDGYIAVMIYNDRHWSNFFDAIGNPEWSKDPMFASLRSRTQNITKVLGQLSEVLAQRTTDEWMDLLTKAQCPAMPVRSIDDLIDDPHLEAVGFWQRFETPDGLVRMPGVPVRFSETPGQAGRPGPRLGSDSRDVLSEAGFSESEIDDLVVPSKGGQAL